MEVQVMEEVAAQEAEEAIGQKELLQLPREVLIL